MIQGRQQIVSVSFGIPEICFEEHSPGFKRVVIEKVFSALEECDASLADKAEKCLLSYGKYIEFPFWIKGVSVKNGWRTSRDIEACNLLPKLMSLPFSVKGESIFRSAPVDCSLSRPENKCKWSIIDSVERTSVKDVVVHSFDVDKHHTYVTDGGLVTCNSIYGWRGARYKNITDFVASHKDCKVIELGQNYRSTPEITAVADALISKNKSNMGSGIKTVKLSGSPVIYRVFDTPEAESECLSRQVYNWMSSGVHQPSEVAVLYRVNSMSRTIEETFRRLRIPYRLVGGFSFYDRSEIKDCFAMLRLAVNPQDTVAFTRLSEFMPGMGEKSVHKIEEQAIASGKSFTSMCAAMKEQVPACARESCEIVSRAYSHNLSSANVGQVLSHLVTALRYGTAMAKSTKKDVDDRMDNVKELIASTMSPEHANRGVSEYLQQMQLMTSDDKTDTENRATLMSMHAAKGLEFPVVFIVGAEEGLLPHERAVTESPDGLEEERRLFYVAITRAKDNLFISSCKTRRKAGGRNAPSYSCRPSRFLVESGLITK
jgi:DNA helicase II / ATP-dependent DNA helicase PcrA